MATGLGDLRGADLPDAEVSIRMAVPEEFAGASMDEFRSRRGQITTMDVRSGTIVVRGSLPASEFQGFQHIITVVTQRQGRVEQEGI